MEERYRSCTDACSARHFQTIWLLAQGHTIEEAAETTCFVPRWIEELLARYNAVGPQALGDLRRNNGAPPSVLKPELLAKLRARLNEPPPDGGLWTSGKVAHWMAGELGLAKVRAQRGLEALKAIGWSIQSRAAVAERCCSLLNAHDIIKSNTNFHWWPKSHNPT